MQTSAVRSLYFFARSRPLNHLHIFVQRNPPTVRSISSRFDCSIDLHFSTASDEHSVPVNQLSSSAQTRVLELITQFKEGPHFKNTKGQQRIVKELEQWVKDNNSKPTKYVFDFLSRICINHGSGQDINMLTSFAKAQGCSLTNGLSNLILSGMSRSDTIDRVKETLKEFLSKGTKVRVNTQTDLLQRAVNERDFLFALEIIHLMKEDGNFPSSTRVVDNVIGACVVVEGDEAVRVVEGDEVVRVVEGDEAVRVVEGDEVVRVVEGDEAVRVVEGVMNMHNHCRWGSYKHEVEQSTAKAFTTWIRRL